jgi:hypothetical protein
MGFKITRQRDSADNNRLFVECACGGKKNESPDVLTTRYASLGEGKNLVSPKDAIAIAERIMKAWDKDYFDENKALRIVGLDKPIEFANTKNGLAEAYKWAEKVLTDMATCGNCNKIMGSRTPSEIADIPNKVFCSELCMSSKFRHMFGTELPAVGATKKKKTLTI